MKILLVDDHTAIRLGLKLIISEVNAEIEVFEESNGRSALIKILENDFDSVILDIDLPELSGFEILKKARESGKTTPVLMLSMYPEEKYAIQAIKLGANGYLSKESAKEELQTAIETIIKGKKYISEKVAEVFADFIEKGENEFNHNNLSKREFQILRLIGEGKSTNEIAKILSINVKTVFTYKSRLMEKMDFHSTGDIVKYVIKNNLV